MEELEKKIAELKAAMTPEAIQNLNDEEVAQLRALIEKLMSMMDGIEEQTWGRPLKV